MVPSLKERLRLRTPPKQQQVFLGEFDRVLKVHRPRASPHFTEQGLILYLACHAQDILEHQNEIHSKLAAVIPSRLEVSKLTFRVRYPSQKHLAFSLLTCLVFFFLLLLFCFVFAFAFAFSRIQTGASPRRTPTPPLPFQRDW